MDTLTAQPRIAVPRADDPAITQALAALEEKIAQWVASMSAGQGALRQALAANPQSSAAPASVTPAPPAHTPITTDAPAAPVAPAPPAASAQRSEVAADGPPVAAREAADPVPASGSAMFTGRKSPKPTPAAAPAAPAQDDEDEALLATLDKETAAAIRVKRRVLKGKKSVRELLEELRAGGEASKDAGSGKKRWWGT